MVKIDSEADVLAAADTAIAALERGLLDYETELETWSAGLRGQQAQQATIDAQARDRDLAAEQVFDRKPDAPGVGYDLGQSFFR